MCCRELYEPHNPSRRVACVTMVNCRIELRFVWKLIITVSASVYNEMRADVECYLARSMVLVVAICMLLLK